MWYHASLQFDYINFSIEAKALAKEIEAGNITPLRLKAEEVLINQYKDSSFFPRYYGQILVPLLDVEHVINSPYKNSILGKWFFVIMAKYLEPSKADFGYQWSALHYNVGHLGWADHDTETMFDGFPIGTLFQENVSPQKRIEHSDPYFYWIRSPYSYNQGGWLPIEKCTYFLTLLKDTQPKVENYDFSPFIKQDQEDKWKLSLKMAFQDGINLFEGAVANHKGIYSAIHWEWDDANEED